jgi:hypothetical protein
MKNYIFGDTGGHADALISALESIGLDIVTMKLPEDVRVVHLGDLIHKGPDSEKLLAFVDKVMEENPGQWIQLMGNHESQYFKGAPWFWNDRIDVHGLAVLGKWKQEGLIHYAYALDHNDLTVEISAKPKLPIPADKDILLTHSGITQWFWTKLKKPKTAKESADLINSMSIHEVSQAGVMLYGPSKHLKPGPMWALSSEEVYLSWLKSGVDMPFIQIHGHTAAFNWMLRKWWANTPKAFQDNTVLNPRVRASITSINNSVQIGLDPGFENNRDLATQPFLSFSSQK